MDSTASGLGVLNKFITLVKVVPGHIINTYTNHCITRPGAEIKGNYTMYIIEQCKQSDKEYSGLSSIDEVHNIS